jgi:hypothetical protein
MVLRHVSGYFDEQHVGPFLQVNQSQAEANCNRNGGHLAAYTSLEEQMEVRLWRQHGAAAPQLTQLLAAGSGRGRERIRCPAQPRRLRH